MPIAVLKLYVQTNRLAKRKYTLFFQLLWTVAEDINSIQKVVVVLYPKLLKIALKENQEANDSFLLVLTQVIHFSRTLSCLENKHIHHYFARNNLKSRSRYRKSNTYTKITCKNVSRNKIIDLRQKQSNYKKQKRSRNLAENEKEEKR